MAKDIRSRWVLDASPFRQTLDAEAKHYNRVRADIEKGSGQSMASIRGGLLGGLGSGEGTREARRFIEEQKALARSGKEVFDAQSGGGMFGRTTAKDMPLERSRMTLERTVKTAAMVAAGISAIDIATKAFSGDIQEAAETIKRLPFGIGEIAKRLESVVGDWSGINREIASANSRLEYQNAINDSLARNTKQRRDYEREIADAVGRNRNAVALAGIDDEYKKSRASLLIQTEEERKSADGTFAQRKKQIEDEAKIRREAIDKDAKEQRRIIDEAERMDVASAAQGEGHAWIDHSKYTKRRSAVDSDVGQSKSAVDKFVKDETAKAAEEANKLKRSIDDKYRAEDERINREHFKKLREAEVSEKEQANKDKTAKDKQEKDKQSREQASREEEALAAQRSLMMRREAEYLERKRQSIYNPFGGNAALQSNTLERAPGAGNATEQTAVNTKRLISIAERQARAAERLERVIERMQTAPADLGVAA
jgi:hypothetical protein